MVILGTILASIDDDGSASGVPIAVRSRLQVRSMAATEVGEHIGDRLLSLVADELADLGCSGRGAAVQDGVKEYQLSKSLFLRMYARM